MTETSPVPGDRQKTVLIAHPGAELYGSDRVMVESASAFEEAGWHVVVALPQHGPLTAELARRGIEVRISRTPVLRRAYLRGWGPARLAALTLRSIGPGVRLFRTVRPDVVYVSTLTIPLWLLLARLLGARTLCHVHEAESTTPRIVRTALASPLVLADRIVVNSRFTASVVAGAVPWLEKRCRVVYNAVTGPPTVTPPRESLDGGVRLLYLGRVSERKGVLDAVEAVAELERRGVRATLDIVGSVFPGYEWVEEELRRRADDSGVAGRIRLHGFDLDIWRHLRDADILVVPSRMDESFGNTAVEGGLAGRPVIASSCGGLTEATAGMHGGMNVPPGSPGALADAVAQLAQTWPEVRDRAMRDSVFAAERYSPNTYRAAVAEEVSILLT